MKTTHGDLIEYAVQGRYDIIVHGCNCQGVMGAGIAKQIRDAFPEAYAADRMCRTMLPTRKLGSFSSARVVRNGYEFVVANAYTQLKPGRGSLDYDAVRSAFKALRAKFPGPLRWGYPAVGAGLGGGDWSILSGIIDEELADLDHELVLLP